MQQSLALTDCCGTLNLRIEININSDSAQRGDGSEVSKSLHPVDAHLRLEKNQTPKPASNAVEDNDTLTSLQARLETVEKNCSRYFDLYKTYRLRWLEENHRARVLEKYAPNVDGYSPAQMPWDAPSPQMGSDVFSANGSMGTMPERITVRSSDINRCSTNGMRQSQAEFFWASSIAVIPPAITPAVIPLVAPTIPPAASGTAVGQRLNALLRTAIGRVTNALRVVLQAGLHAAKKFVSIFRWA
ncbi:hypothetical protein CY34DRAFT_110800 [Suillus luteus UH-Slu-Lm8-n1]|uniref:Uncharacterized protein n=1 Tax=Suillus luteus UH-Slu-Lm8-n1 TaxID=930992 RepID=A0A0D0AFD9_9AGAM|nr:hypothetical protein CY34DRAFT_110800 [Suillus luteus UH-Slu-Lm8-n1]